MSSIKFNRQQWERLVAKRKHATVRKGHHHIAPGPAIVQCGDDLAVVMVTDVIITTYGRIDYPTAVLEGYSTLEEFLAVLKDIYPDIRDEDIVTVILFDEVIWNT